MFGKKYWLDRHVSSPEMNLFSSGRSTDAVDGEDGFDDPETFVPEHVPGPGPFLEGHSVLEGEDHVDFHDITRSLFEERGVYDATFGYNLSRLNLDRRHLDAGYRYAVDVDDGAVLRAEFSPTTEFRPQAEALVKESFRVWNGLSDRHEYDLVRVRVRPTHHQFETVNETLERLEARYREFGEVPSEPLDTGSSTAVDEERGEDTSVQSPF